MQHCGNEKDTEDKCHFPLPLCAERLVFGLCRVSELLAVVSLTSTCMLFLHTSHLQSQLATYTNQLDASGPASTFTNGQSWPWA
ncbi:hypothetical protein E2C01_073162 [Portunus trituberculatus]|uniref:Uncharacterized protein n=1 Tax=Portunus trituberculatus TaxID=210409 RepID=A0A5B7ICL0_PORTR|nr:hypothetical protein [Portunus trituberculatus]